eukprot:14795455-Heterocapsa_arctica.AAC.1
MKKAHGKSAKPNVKLKKPKVVMNNLKVVPKSKSKEKSKAKSEERARRRARGITRPWITSIP